MENAKHNTLKYQKTILQYLDKMPSLSTTVTKVLSICSSPETSANDLSRVVSLDPVLTGNVLKLINSAYYSMREKMTSLTQAIIMLGLNTVKNLALSTAILGTITNKLSAQNKLMDNFWSHCITTGVTSKAIALKKGILKSDCEQYFVAGLLHDIGKIPLIQSFPDEYMKICNFAVENNKPISILEKTLLGISHEETGKLLADKWKLQGSIFQVICYHHKPEHADEVDLDIVQRTAIANSFSKLIPTTQMDENIFNDSIFKELLRYQNLSLSSIVNLEEGIIEEIESAKTFMQIAKG